MADIMLVNRLSVIPGYGTTVSMLQQPTSECTIFRIPDQKRMNYYFVYSRVQLSRTWACILWFCITTIFWTPHHYEPSSWSPELGFKITVLHCIFYFIFNLYIPCDLFVGHGGWQGQVWCRVWLVVTWCLHVWNAFWRNTFLCRISIGDIQQDHGTHSKSLKIMFIYPILCFS